MLVRRRNDPVPPPHGAMRTALQLVWIGLDDAADPLSVDRTATEVSDRAGHAKS